MSSLLDYIVTYPRTSIILMALVISFLISLVNYFVLDKEKMRSIKEKQKALQEQMKQHKDNPVKMMEIQKEMMGHMSESMKHSFKPMLITLIPLLFIYAFLRTEFALTAIKGSWFWYYLVTSIIGSMFFRKVFNLP